MPRIGHRKRGMLHDARVVGESFDVIEVKGVVDGVILYLHISILARPAIGDL